MGTAKNQNRKALKASRRAQQVGVVRRQGVRGRKGFLLSLVMSCGGGGSLLLVNLRGFFSIFSHSIAATVCVCLCFTA